MLQFLLHMSKVVLFTVLADAQMGRFYFILLLTLVIMTSRITYPWFFKQCLNNGIAYKKIQTEGPEARTLEMFFSGFPRLIGMHHFPNLTTLTVIGQLVSKMEGLASLPLLEELWIAECQITVSFLVSSSFTVLLLRFIAVSRLCIFLRNIFFQKDFHCHFLHWMLSYFTIWFTTVIRNMKTVLIS